MPRRLVIWKHALKNAAIPVFTLFTVNLAHLISYAVVTETIYAWPGIGRLLVDSIFARDDAVSRQAQWWDATEILGDLEIVGKARADAFVVPISPHAIVRRETLAALYRSLWNASKAIQ